MMGAQEKTKEVAFSKSSLLGGKKLYHHTVVCRIYLKYRVLYVYDAAHNEPTPVTTQFTGGCLLLLSCG
jgi:hypothetical protein